MVVELCAFPCRCMVQCPVWGLRVLADAEHCGRDGSPCCVAVVAALSCSSDDVAVKHRLVVFGLAGTCCSIPLRVVVAARGCTQHCCAGVAARLWLV